MADLCSHYVSQTRLFNSCLCVINAPHVPQHLRNSHALLPRVFFLWLSKHVWLLKCLLHRSHWILGPADIQGGLTIQSLHVCSQVCSTPFLQPSQRYRLAMAPVRLDMTWQCCYLVKLGINALVGLDMSLKRGTFTIQSWIHHGLIFVKMLLKSV